jgi:hypothetical protein
MRFSIRDVLWLTLVVGLVLWWWCWWRSLAVTDEGFIQGIALVSGKPIDSGRVFLHSSDGQFRGTQVSKGWFSLQGVPYGKYRLTFEGDNVPPNKFDAELDKDCQALGGTYAMGP